MKLGHEIRGLRKSFTYAWKGVLYCVKNERNMRIHLTVAVLVAVFSVFYRLNRTEYAVLTLTFASVFFCEIINTAMETLVNLGTSAYDNLARIAKDVAAGAVLFTAVLAVLVGVFLFGDPQKLADALWRIVDKPLSIVLFGGLGLLGSLFVFLGVKPLKKFRK